MYGALGVALRHTLDFFIRDDKNSISNQRDIGEYKLIEQHHEIRKMSLISYLVKTNVSFAGGQMKSC